jgi:hypothetical protein
VIPKFNYENMKGGAGGGGIDLLILKFIRKKFG